MGRIVGKFLRTEDTSQSVEHNNIKLKASNQKCWIIAWNRREKYYHIVNLTISFT